MLTLKQKREGPGLVLRATLPGSEQVAPAQGLSAHWEGRAERFRVFFPLNAWGVHKALRRPVRLKLHWQQAQALFKLNVLGATGQGGATDCQVGYSPLPPPQLPICGASNSPKHVTQPSLMA